MHIDRYGGRSSSSKGNWDTMRWIQGSSSDTCETLALLLLLYGSGLPCHEQSQPGLPSMRVVVGWRVLLSCAVATGLFQCLCCGPSLAAGAFKFETKLEVLKLGWCKVGGNEGSRAMADLLMYNKTLRQVRAPHRHGRGFAAAQLHSRPATPLPPLHHPPLQGEGGVFPKRMLHC
jgi:hypothetical protein